MSSRLHFFQNLLALSATTLIITVWATVTFLVYQNKLLEKYSTDYFAQNTYKPSNDQFSNWKTYRNEKYEFELKYPNNFVDIETWLSGYQDKLPVTISFHQKLDENSRDGEGLFITINDIEEYKKTYSIDIPEGYINKVKKLEKKVQINEVLIDGEKAFKFKYGDGKSMELLFTEPNVYRGPIEYITMKNKRLYVFEYQTDNQELISVFDQILSTFRFINDTESLTPSPTRSLICPSNGWVDCMPILSEEKQKLCTQDAINWYKENCPNYQGIAY